MTEERKYERLLEAKEYYEKLSALEKDESDAFDEGCEVCTSFHWDKDTTLRNLSYKQGSSLLFASLSAVFGILACIVGIVMIQTMEQYRGQLVKELIPIVIIPTIATVFFAFRYIRYKSARAKAEKNFDKQYQTTTKPLLKELEEEYYKKRSMVIKYENENSDVDYFLPSEYRNYDAVTFFIDAIDYGKAETLAEAFMLYSQDRHRRKVLEAAEERRRATERLSDAMYEFNAKQNEIDTKLARANQLLEDIEREQRNQRRD